MSIETETIVKVIQSWLDWQQREYDAEGIPTGDDTAVMTFPKGPSRGQLKNWIAYLSAGPSGWHPIATAPRDGTMVLAFVPGADDPRDAVQTAYCGRTANNRDLWVIGGFSSWDMGGTPSHWQPLPEPPK